MKRSLETNETERLKEMRMAETRTMLDNRKKRLDSAGIHKGSVITDSDWFDVVLDRLDDTRSLKAVRLWHSRSKDPYLVLLGVPGCGKTVASSWAIAKVGGYYLSAKQAERTFAAQFGDAVDEQARIIAKLGLVVVDDIGTETNRDMFVAALFEILNGRQGGDRRTILTSNLTKDEFDAEYDDPRIVSRLRRATFIGDDSGDRRSK